MTENNENDPQPRIKNNCQKENDIHANKIAANQRQMVMDRFCNSSMLIHSPKWTAKISSVTWPSSKKILIH